MRTFCCHVWVISVEILNLVIKFRVLGYVCIGSVYQQKRFHGTCTYLKMSLLQDIDYDLFMSSRSYLNSAGSTSVSQYLHFFS